MKTKVILLLSFYANIAFAAYWFTRPQPVAPAPAAEGEQSTVAKAVETRFKRGVDVKVITETNDFHWATVESEDYRRYIENLRAIGCPEDTIRDIIIADINKLYASRILALYPSPKDFKFWRVEDRVARNEERERDEKRRDLEREKRDLIKELLGVDYEAEMARLTGRPEENRDAFRYGFLSPEKEAQVRALSDKYREQERALWSEGGMSAENRAKYAALRAQREAELAAILGPQDFQEYMLRNSWTARSMRENLASFQPNEEEFRKIFEIRKAYDDQFGFTRDGGDEAIRQQRQLAQQQLDEQLKGLLGAERYRQYQMANDDRFRDMYEFAERNNLPRQTAEGIYDMRLAAENAKKQLEAQANLSEEARKEALKLLATQTDAALRQSLGDNYADYIRRDGRWITRLETAGDSRDGRRDFRRN